MGADGQSLVGSSSLIDAALELHPQPAPGDPGAAHDEEYLSGELHKPVTDRGVESENLVLMVYTSARSSTVARPIAGIATFEIMIPDTISSTSDAKSSQFRR